MKGQVTRVLVAAAVVLVAVCGFAIARTAWGRPQHDSAAMAEAASPGVMLAMGLLLATFLGGSTFDRAYAASRERGSPVSAGPHAPLVLPAAWEYSAPLISPVRRTQDQSVSQKDPSVVFTGGRWHVFMTVKCEGLTAIEYCSFDRWENADRAPRTIVRVSQSRYYGAPQVFYFRPHRKWYLVYQVGVPDQDKMWVAYSTTANIADPTSWTQAEPILAGDASDPREEGGLDYWIICDDQRAYLFFTSLNGKLWRLWTRLEDFPRGFGHCELALQADIFEASHTYRLKGRHQYLTIVEANPGGRRFYKAYVADRLDGAWTPAADSAEKPFASWHNILPAPGVEAWTNNVSHGELIREGTDERMLVDPAHLRFVFQGMLESEKQGKGYGQFPWRIGLLTPASEMSEST